MGTWNPGTPALGEGLDSHTMVNVWITWHRLGESDVNVHKDMLTTAAVAAINTEEWAKELAHKAVYSTMVARWHDIVIDAVSYTEPKEGEHK